MILLWTVNNRNASSSCEEASTVLILPYLIFNVVLGTFILWLGNETLTTFAYIDMKLALSLFNGFLQSLLYFPKMKIMFPNYLETSETFYQLSEIFILPLQIFWHKPLTWLWLNLCYFNVLSLSSWTWPSERPAVIN